MRKTLAVLALMIGSLLFLAAPAWAHHLYKVTKVQTLGTTAEGLKKTAYWAATDCSTGASFTSSAWSPGDVGGTRAGQDAAGHPKYTFSANLRPNKVANLDNTDVTCLSASGAALPFTGRAVARQLLLGIGLVLVGGLLIAVTVRRPVDVTRRG
jgi:hypothetical protein